VLNIVLLFTFCKKDKTKAGSETATETLPAGNYGSFSSGYNTYVFADQSGYTDSSVFASFYAYPDYLPSSALANAGDVTVNGSLLNRAASNFYSLSGKINLKHLEWTVSGNGTITAGSFSYTPSHPVFNSASAFPDTIAKANGFSIDLTGVSGANSPGLNFLLIGQAGISIDRNISNGSQNITVTAAELADFNTGENLIFYLSLANNSSVVFNNRNYLVNNTRTFTKYCYVK